MVFSRLHERHPFLVPPWRRRYGALAEADQDIVPVPGSLGTLQFVASDRAAEARRLLIMGVRTGESFAAAQ